ncbi:MAG: cobyrinate a,c-diamide synthase [Synergistaceae bacterium]|jgi:cobyrinic acid a,c-diamide synthase|nr:cobyrinate a,c-diamide synthase [Synergistaceae bacterium]
MPRFAGTRGFVLAATSSGVGKTTVASALCRALSENRAVQPFKTGPDFIDPTYLTLAAGRRCRSLDGYPCRDMVPWLYSYGCEARDGHPKADIAVVEGVMGMYDGLGPDGLYSTAWLAKALGLPVILLVDAKASVTSVAATAKGFAALEPLAPRVVGVIANRVSGERHAEMIGEAVTRFAGLPLLGWLRDIKDSRFPSRHLGLVPAAERKNTDETIELFAAEIKSRVDVERIANMAAPPSCHVRAPDIPGTVKKSDGSPARVAIANDDAFCFHYHENWELFEKLGAKTEWTSPLNDRSLPEADILVLPGGYPEEFAGRLSQNSEYIESVRKFSAKGRIYAECGGMMYLTNSMESGGVKHAGAGVINATARMGGALRHFGYVAGEALRDNMLFREGESVKAHEFHYSDITGEPPGAFRVTRASGGGEEWTDGYAIGDRLLATYLHINFYSCPSSAARLLSM